MCSFRSHQPKLVLCDLDTLSTLPYRELRSGLAEVIKYGIIWDAELFARLEKEMDELLQRSSAKLSSTIAQCCAIKAEVVGKDEKEGGLRAILNYGHTLGHALEAISGYGHYLHGEAISIGMVAASHLSARLMEMPAKDVLRIRALLGRAGLPTSFKLAARQKDKLFEAMRLDKKVTGGEVQFVLAKRIGEVVWGSKVSDGEIRWALDQIAPGKE